MLFVLASSKGYLIYNEETLVVICFLSFVFTTGPTVYLQMEAALTEISTQHKEKFNELISNHHNSQVNILENFSASHKNKTMSVYLNSICATKISKINEKAAPSTLDYVIFSLNFFYFISQSLFYVTEKQTRQIFRNACSMSKVNPTLKKKSSEKKKGNSKRKKK